MVDTIRTLSALQTLHADNTEGAISPQDNRDLLVSGWTPENIRYLHHRLPDETPHTDDKFFAEGAPASASSGTAVTASGTGTWTEGRNRLHVAADNQSSNDITAYLWAITSASAPITIETKGRLLSKLDANPMWGLIFTDGTTTSSTVAGHAIYQGNNVALTINANFTGTPTSMSVSNVHSDLDPGFVHMGLYMRLIWTATNTFAWSFSLDGVNWSDFDASTFAQTITPTHFGVWASTWGQAYTVPAAFDYFRVYDADLSV